jgi:hypothetical protein
MNQDELHNFIVKAKAATYIGDGEKSPACRPESHDLKFQEGDFAYWDSYFGGADFLGQEVVYFQGKAIWAMNYYGYLLRPDLIKVEEVGQILKKSLSWLYEDQGRFLGGFDYKVGDDVYTDTNEGDFAHFMGKEWITRHDVRVYELVYHGGLIK